jgi:hypothetical protein
VPHVSPRALPSAPSAEYAIASQLEQLADRLRDVVDTRPTWNVPAVVEKLLMMTRAYRATSTGEADDLVDVRIEVLETVISMLGGRPDPSRRRRTSSGTEASTAGAATHHQRVVTALESVDKKQDKKLDMGKPATSSHGPLSAVTLPHLATGPRKVLGAIHQGGEEGRLKNQLRIITGLRTRTVNDYIHRLSALGYIVRRGDRFLATEEGHQAVGGGLSLPRGDALRAFWLAKLPGGPARILELVCAVYPDPMTKRDIDEETGHAVRTRNDYLYKLHALELVEEVGDGVRASATLFEPGHGLHGPIAQSGGFSP